MNEFLTSRDRVGDVRTLADVLKAAVEELKSIDNPTENAERICEHVLGISRLELHWRRAESLAEEVCRRIQRCVRRRALHEPLQYVLGETEFYGFRLFLNRNVLIPRPETEELVHQLTQIYSPSQSLKILDLGTGSGAIAIALAHLFPLAVVTAVDVSLPAVRLAARNARWGGVRDRITFVSGDTFRNIRGTFDLIVANPPYLSEEEWKETAPEIRNFEPKVALVSPDCGLYMSRRILDLSPSFLNTGGLLALEIGESHHVFLAEHAQFYSRHEVTRDLCGRRRFFWSWK
jgi:release factor glutamine methyltransferase